MAEDTLLDDTPCPACACPAATHYRDVATQAFKCPPGGDPVKLMEMVRRAPRVPNAVALAARPAQLGPANLRFTDDATIEKYLYNEGGAGGRIRELVPLIREIGVKRPEMSMRDVVRLARQVADDYDRVRGQEDRISEAARVAWELTRTRGLDAAPAVGYAAERLRNYDQKDATPKPAPKTKRRFNLDEEE